MAVFLESEFQLGINQASTLVYSVYESMVRHTPQESDVGIYPDIMTLQKEVDMIPQQLRTILTKQHEIVQQLIGPQDKLGIFTYKDQAGYEARFYHYSDEAWYSPDKSNFSVHLTSPENGLSLESKNYGGVYKGFIRTIYTDRMVEIKRGSRKNPGQILVVTTGLSVASIRWSREGNGFINIREVNLLS